MFHRSPIVIRLLFALRLIRLTEDLDPPILMAADLGGGSHLPIPDECELLPSARDVMRLSCILLHAPPRWIHACARSFTLVA
jgi:hypothetical protein